MQNLRRDKIPISLLPSAFYQEKSCNRPPLFWHTGQGRDRGSVVVSAVGAPPKGAAASGAGGPAEGRCLGRRLLGCEPRAAAFAWERRRPPSSVPRRGWRPSSWAPSLPSVTCAVGGREAKHNGGAHGHGTPRGEPSGKGPLRAPRWEPHMSLGRRRRGRALGGRWRLRA